jgi:hypothetical protein
VDVGVFLREGSPDELLVLARGVDPGIETEDIVAVAARLDRMPDRELADYGLDAAAIAELRDRFLAWPRAE